jgi:hypothetical protein
MSEVTRDRRRPALDEAGRAAVVTSPAALAEILRNALATTARAPRVLRTKSLCGVQGCADGGRA